jgi:uncharacterized delta-60 repeat protein
MESSLTTLAGPISRLAALALVAGALAASCLASSAAATVSFDPTFGTNGTSYAGGLSYVGGAAQDADGRIAVAGSQAPVFMKFGAARFDASGKPDNSFGSGGVVVDAMPGPDLPGYFQAHSTDVAVQPDHKLVLVGWYQVASVKSLLAVVRLNENGTVDTDFGDGGRVLLDLQDGAQANAVQIASNGDIVVGGSSFDNSPAYVPNVVAVRLDSNGDPVNSFGGDGVASTDLSGSATIDATDVLVDGDGVLVVAGRDNQIALTRFKADGDLDAAYGSGGTAHAAFPENSGPGKAVRLADGRVVVSGGSGAGFALARFSASGQLDASYGFGGMLTLGFAGTSFAADVAVRSNGKVIAVGHQGDLNGGGPVTIAMAGTTAEGLRDDSFGNAGRVTTQLPLTSRSSANTALLDAQGRLLVVGGAGQGIGMARYLVDDVVPEGGTPGASLDADFPSAIKSSKLKGLDGDLVGAAEKVDVALRLNLSSGAKGVGTAKSSRRCQWLKTAKAKFTKVKKQAGCDRKTWLHASIKNGHWKLALKRHLPKGKYTVFVRALDGAAAAAAHLEKSLKVK